MGSYDTHVASPSLPFYFLPFLPENSMLFPKHEIVLMLGSWFWFPFFIQGGWDSEEDSLTCCIKTRLPGPSFRLRWPTLSSWDSAWEPPSLVTSLWGARIPPSTIFCFLPYVFPRGRKHGCAVLIRLLLSKARTIWSQKLRAGGDDRGRGPSAHKQTSLPHCAVWCLRLFLSLSAGEEASIPVPQNEEPFVDIRYGIIS